MANVSTSSASHRAGSAAPPTSLARALASRKMAALLLLGFSSGLPLYLTSKTLQAWMTVEKVDLTTIGLFSLVGLPVSLKFLWAPLLDRYVPPFLGRRRGWLIVTQILLLLVIAAMSLQDPQRGLRMLALNAVLIAFFSASQDIVGDAYRTDVLEEREMGTGAAIWVLGYRVAMLVVGSAAFILADQMPWPRVYLVMALLMLIGIGATLWAPEPVLHGSPPRSLYEAIVLPFRDFFSRAAAWRAVVALVFIILYKLPDNLAIGMSTPFLLEIGFSQEAIGAIAGGIGLGATIVGSFVGAALIVRTGINRSLWIAAVLQSLSQLGYYALSLTGKSQWMLVLATILENVVYGLVTAVLTAFLMSICSKRFSATQYALLSSLMAVSRDLLLAPAGAIATRIGWPSYFLFALASGVPALLLLPLLAPWRLEVPLLAADHSGETTTEPERAGGDAPR